LFSNTTDTQLGVLGELCMYYVSSPIGARLRAPATQEPNKTDCSGITWSPTLSATIVGHMAY